MRLVSLVIAVSGLVLAGNVLADTVVAKSGMGADACNVTATDVTWMVGKETLNGVEFKFTAPDGDRLDLHSKKLVIKSGKDGQTVFVKDLTTKDVVKDFAFDEHDAKAGSDSESHHKTKQAKFVPAA